MRLNEVGDDGGPSSFVFCTAKIKTGKSHLI